jgi:hypothetical protein
LNNGLIIILNQFLSNESNEIRYIILNILIELILTYGIINEIIETNILKKVIYIVNKDEFYNKFKGKQFKNKKSN